MKLSFLYLSEDNCQSVYLTIEIEKEPKLIRMALCVFIRGWKLEGFLQQSHRKACSLSWTVYGIL